jgi:hypothetical protein
VIWKVRTSSYDLGLAASSSLDTFYPQEAETVTDTRRIPKDSARSPKFQYPLSQLHINGEKYLGNLKEAKSIRMDKLDFVERFSSCHKLHFHRFFLLGGEEVLATRLASAC